MCFGDDLSDKSLNWWIVQDQRECCYLCEKKSKAYFFATAEDGKEKALCPNCARIIAFDNKIQNVPLIDWNNFVEDIRTKDNNPLPKQSDRKSWF
jgi:hypothetical protein